MLKPNNRTRLRIGHLSTLYHTSFILEGTDWLEKKLDLEIEWKLFGGGPAIVKAFANRELDIGYIGLPPVMIGIDKGVNIKCVAGGHIEGTIFMGRDIYKSLGELGGDMNALFKQFIGHKIGSPPSGSIHDVIIRHYLNKFDYNKAIIVRNYDWADFIPGAILDGEINAAVGTPPLAVLCTRGFNSKIIISPDKLWPYNPSYGIIASTDLIQESPELVEEFISLHEEASNLIRTKPEKAVEIVNKVMRVVDREFISESYMISPKYCASLPKEYIDSTLAFVPILYKLKYINKILNKQDIFDLRFIKKVHLEHPHYDIKSNKNEVDFYEN